MKKNILTILSLILLNNCAPKIKNFPAYVKQPILRSEFVKKEDLEKSKPSVVVLNFNAGKNDIANKANLDETLLVATENFLVKNKLVELKDRKAFEKLSEEIALAELNGDSNVEFEGPVAADFAISGEISNAGFNHRYVAASNYYDFKSKTFTSNPAKNIYTANFREKKTDI